MGGALLRGAVAFDDRAQPRGEGCHRLLVCPPVVDHESPVLDVDPFLPPRLLSYSWFRAERRFGLVEQSQHCGVVLLAFIRHGFLALQACLADGVPGSARVASGLIGGDRLRVPAHHSQHVPETLLEHGFSASAPYLGLRSHRKCTE